MLHILGSLWIFRDFLLNWYTYHKCSCNLKLITKTEREKRDVRSIYLTGNLSFKHFLSQSYIISHWNKELFLDSKLFLWIYGLNRTPILLPFWHSLSFQGRACVCSQYLCICQCESPLNYAKCGKSSSYLWKRKDGRDVGGAPNWYHL